MNIRKQYPYDQALDDLEKIIYKYISDEEIRTEFIEIIDSSRQRQTVPMRYIHEKLFSYRKEKSNYFKFETEDRELIEDLIHFWS